MAPVARTARWTPALAARLSFLPAQTAALQEARLGDPSFEPRPPNSRERFGPLRTLAGDA